MSAHRERNVHGILGLIIVLIGLLILLIYTQYEEVIIASGNFQLFVFLTAVVLGLLAYLFFLGGKVVGNSKKSSKKSSRRK